MKNTLLKILCVVFSITMTLCIFAGCGKNSGEDGAETDASGSAIGEDGWSQGLPGYVQIELTADEITEFVKQVLGDKCPKDFNGDLSTLSKEELSAVSNAAVAAGYNIYKDGNGKIKINKTVPEEEAKTDAVLTNVEIVDLVKEALGDDTPENFNGDINTLSDKQLDKVIKKAKDKGLVVTDNREVTTTVKDSSGKKDSGKKGSDDKSGNKSTTSASSAEVPTSRVSFERVTKVYEPTTAPSSTGKSSGNKSGKSSGNSSGSSSGSSSGNYESPATRYTPPADSGNLNKDKTTTKASSNEPTTKNNSVSNKVQPVCISKTDIKGYYTYKGTEYSSSCYSESDGTAVMGGLDQGGGGEFKKACGVVSKISRNGNVIWSKNIGGDEITAVTDVAILKDDSIIATGYTVSKKFYDVLNTDKNAVNTFYAKFSKGGDMKWIKLIDSSNEGTNGYAVAAAPDGGFYLGGYSKATDGNFEGYQGAIKAFVFKYDSDGNYLKGHALTATKSNSVRSICVNDSGDVFAVFQTATATGDYALIDGIRENVISTVVVKYSPDLKVKWFCALSDNGAINTDAITYTNDGGCVVAGEFKCSPKGNTHSLSGINNSGENGSYDGVVVKINSDGKISWAHEVAGFKNDYVTDICRLAGGYAYGITGYTTSTNKEFVFAENLAAGDYDGYIFVLDANGKVQNNKNYFGGSAVDTPKTICARNTFTKDELKKIKKEEPNKVFPITEEMYVAGYTNSKDGSFKDCSFHSDNGVPFVVAQDSWISAGNGAGADGVSFDVVGSSLDFVAWREDL